jgi:hypothetical protein
MEPGMGEKNLYFPEWQWYQVYSLINKCITFENSDVSP